MSRLNHGLLVLFIISGWSALFPSVTPFTAPIQAAPTVQSDTGIAPPPLPRSCIRGGTPIDDYDRAACCVSGYVYLNGVPIAGAEVVVEVAGRQTTVTTTAPAPGELASFSVNLSDAPLRAQPGDTVTMTASAGGQTRTTEFIVQAGGQQIDIALPQSAVDATWEVGEASIGGRAYHGAVYDSRRGRTILFGGQSGTNVVNDTWEWDGRSWQRLRTPIAPSARTRFGMAYDSARGRVLLFGGRGAAGEYLNDTWEWDGTAWTRRTPVNTPTPRTELAMTYDAARGQVMLFGGRNNAEVLGDTWTWDSSNWRLIDTPIAPPKRSSHVLAYDPVRQRSVLFGGNNLNDTWEWDGVKWILRFPPTAPPARTDAAMAYDSSRGRIVLMGGFNGAVLSDAWEYDGNGWEQVDTTISGRYGAKLVFHQDRSRLIITGGKSQTLGQSLPLHETWEQRDDRSWRLISPQLRPGIRYLHAVAYDSDRQRAVLFGGTVASSYTFFNDTWEWDGVTWTPHTVMPSPSHRVGHAMAYDSIRKRVLLFGGGVAGERLNDTWEWDGKVWTLRSLPISPPERTNAMMAFDPQRGQIVLFGGTNASGYLNDFWSWDGTSWSQMTPSVSPPARANAGFVTDTARQRIVLFGGASSRSLNDTWEWDGMEWRQSTSSIIPPTRESPALIYDPLQQRTLLFGGWNRNDNQILLNDTWEWNGVSWSQIPTTLAPASRFTRAAWFDDVRQRPIIFGGYINMKDHASTNDTWMLLRDRWISVPDNSNLPGIRVQSAFAYLQNGRSLLFGGRNGTTFDPNTYEWQGNQWRQLTPLHSPSAREGARIARNSDGSDLLLFGGRAADGTYRADTWAWRDDDWFVMAPPAAPSARGFYGLTFDTQREVWVLFGGQDSARYLNDTWEFDGTTWIRRPVAVSPPPRANATLTYDEQRKMAVLIGGQNTDGALDDVWEWDGTNWREVTPIERLSGRTGHGAAYDSVNGAVVVAGGADASGAALPDTWEWNGRSWTQRLVAQPMPARAFFAMAYDGQRGEIIAFGGLNGSTPVSGTHLHQVLGAVANPLPIATIVQATPRDARQGIDTMTFIGRGSDADATDEITAYRWTHNGVVIGTEPTLIIDPASLPLGQQTISFAVRDNEGAWSQSVLQPVIIRDRDGRTATGASWSFLIYAVGDNDLDLWMGNYATTNGMLYRLSRAGVQPNVHVSILYDGPKSDDTWLYTLDEAGLWTRNRWQGAVEARMDEQATLAAFLTWGQNTYRTDHYALALIDHANGVIGFGQDKTSDSTGQAFLTPAEIRGALQESLDDGARRLDIVLYDGCSFGLLENASIVEGLAHFVVASPNTGWGVFPYEHYRKLIGTVSDPQSLATAIASTYAVRVAAARLPYTISVFDLAAFAPVQTALSNLGDSLLAYIAGDRETRIAQIRTVRLLAQKYDSGGEQLFVIDPEDSYLDVIDFARQLTLAIDDPLVDAAAAEVVRSAKAMIIFTQSRSGSFVARGSELVMEIELNRAHGMGVYYPPRLTTDSRSAYVRYINNEQFTITRNWGWSRFLAAGLPALSAGDPLPMPNDSLIVPLITAEVEARAGNAHTILTTSSGGTISTSDGAAQAAFFSGSVTEDTLIEMIDHVTLPSPLPADATALRVIQIKAQTMGNKPVVQSRVPFRLTMTAPDHPSRALMSAQEQRTYTVLGWNDGQWVTLFPCDWCTMDPETGSVSILSDRFTTFVPVERINNTDANWRLYLPQLQRSVPESAALTTIGAR